MGRTATISRNKKPSSLQISRSIDSGTGFPPDDPRWALAERIVASRHLSRSTLLSRFLLYIMAETIEGRANEITEHAIGVRVFDRPANYRTVEDNIVRNYARQLRKRLADYYADEGKHEEYRIEIPLGGYVPSFPSAAAPLPAPLLTVPAPADSSPSSTPRLSLRSAALFVLYSCAIAAGAWVISARMHTPHPPRSVTDPLWQAMLQAPATAFIVPSDSGFNLVEDARRQALPLANYISGNYLNLPLPLLDDHMAADLRSQEYTSYVDMQIILAMERLPQFEPRHDLVRFPRALHIDDLKNNNVVLIGSEDSNPWVALAENHANFRILDDKGMQGARIVNNHPAAGEAPFYVSHWNEPSHETYALIQYLPNLDGTGHVLLLQGLDVAGTQAAAEALLHPEVIAPVMKKAIRPDGQLRSFEVLLHATSIDSNAAGTQIVASRIY